MTRKNIVKKCVSQQASNGDSRLCLCCRNILNRDRFPATADRSVAFPVPPKWIFWVVAQTCCQDGLEWEFHPVRTTSLSSALLLWEYPGSFLTKAAILNARIVNGGIGISAGSSVAITEACDCAVILNEDVLRGTTSEEESSSLVHGAACVSGHRIVDAMQYV